MNAKWTRRTLGLLGRLAVMLAGGVASGAHQVMAMLKSAPDGCPGVSFTIDLTMQAT